MNLPPHNKDACVTCGDPIEIDALFPFCPVHLEELKRAGRQRQRPCPGATIYDHAMRQQKYPCQNQAESEHQRFCNRCLKLEQQEKARAREAGAHSKCPTCGQLRSPVPPSPAPTKSYGAERQPWRDRRSGND
jgi:predicted nucleic acid-binding Zn ribbon protein